MKGDSVRAKLSRVKTVKSVEKLVKDATKFAYISPKTLRRIVRDANAKKLALAA